LSALAQKGTDSAAKDPRVAKLDELLRQARTARSRLEPIWFMNVAFYEGLHWLAWDGRALFEPKLRPGRMRLVDNRIQPIVRKEVAKLSKSRPVFTAVPNSGDTSDTNAAELTEQLARYMWQHLKLNEQRTKALLWSRICGAGFLKAYWDSTVGPKRQVLVGDAGQVITAPNGAPLDPMMVMGLPEEVRRGVKVKTIAQGDVRVETRSPFQMYPDPIADSWSEAEWVIEESIKSVGWVRDRYGVTLQADTPANPGLIQARMGGGNLLSPGYGGYNGVRVREYWCRPCNEYPNGCRTVWSQNQILDQDLSPFDPFPYVMIRGIEVPGRLWPSSIVEALRPQNVELNKLLSQIAENSNRVGNPTILASKQAINDPDKFIANISSPGGIHFFDDIGSPNTVPTYLQAPPLPEYLIQRIQQIYESIQEIAGQHDVSSASVPPGVTAASAINLLMESDDTMLAPAVEDYEIGLGDLGTKVMRLVAEFYTDQRTIQIGGDNGSWQFIDFKGSMLKGNTRVQVQAGSAFPQSKAAKQAQIQDLMTYFVQSGNPPHGRQLAQFLQDSQIGGAERLVEDYTRTEQQVNRENVKLGQGVPVPINDYDEDQDHIDGHQDFQRTPAYDNLPPQIKQLFAQHVSAHRQRLAAQQTQQLQTQLQLSGMVPANMTPAALQDEQQLSQLDPNDLQAAQLHLQGAQQQLDMQGTAAQQAQQAAQAQAQLQGQQVQQGFQQAQQVQQQRHAEEQHQQRLRHAEEQHQQRLQIADRQSRQQKEGSNAGSQSRR
jgi:hypothetical protein